MRGPWELFGDDAACAAVDLASATMPAVSLRPLDAAGMTTASCVIDIGGGDARLVDRLVDRRMAGVFALDVSGAALARAQARLGPQPERVTWIEADVTGDWVVPAVDIWHDRAVLHFLTDAPDAAPGCAIRSVSRTSARTLR